MLGQLRASRRGARAGIKPAPGEDSLFDRLLHDLRNPVGVIAYYAEAIPSATAPERDEMVTRLRVNAQRALNVLEEFSLLGDLRAGRCRIDPEPCDVAQLMAELSADFEALERRPRGIRSRVEVAAPPAVSRPHVLCALRALLRVVARVTAGDEPLDVNVRQDGAQLLFTITAPLRSDPALGVVVHVPSSGIEIELAERVAALHAGHYALDQEPGRAVLVLALSPRA